MAAKVYSLAFMVVVISFLGFLLENVWLAFTKGYVDNRNMSLPFLLGYGVAVTAIFTLFGLPSEFELPFIANLLVTKKQRKFAYFVLIFFCVSIGEMLLGLTTEKLFGFYYWNYEKIPLHVTRYTSVPTSIGFSLIITFFTENCYLPLFAAIEKLPTFFLQSVPLTLVVILAVDLVKSFGIMHKTHQPNLRRIHYLKLRERRDKAKIRFQI